MKYLKTYEKINNKNIKYYKGDTVICIDNEDQELLEIGKKYIVLEIFTEDKPFQYTQKKYYDSSIENVFVKVIEKNSSQTVSDIFAHRFTSEVDYISNKYNL